MNDTFEKLRIRLDKHTDGLMEPDKAGRILAKVESFRAQIEMEKVIVDKPIDGCVFAFVLPPQLPLPHDGYGWMDEETSVRVQFEAGKEVEVFSRRHGFGIEDRITSMSRRRFRLIINGVHSNLQLLHYSKAPAGIPVTGAAYASPRLPSHFPMSAVHNPLDLARRNHEAQAALQRRIKTRPLPTAAGAKSSDDLKHQPELDKASLTSVSLQRYKRNHELLEMIFSPYPVEHFQGITTAPLVAPADYQSKKAKIDGELAKLKTAHSEHIQKIHRESRSFWNYMDRIKNSQSIEDLEKYESQALKEFGINKKPHRPVIQRQLPSS
ncbi:uncharacterized protein BJ171DRAFT_485104 [Polychytrium aggregatum]|uniref:uncharacterized protein n=1 Tax=Polychytrium aggregatum TaxID=110093 RepID=UPI0022FE3C0D|nr:uncharacterized protein BJ171DRAFT_485104 [Polychytrium aggregatum]KAI9209814.1 hypothetical protein BJ171DRAFT_485104 [Polychytrium aggregatum]